MTTLRRRALGRLAVFATAVAVACKLVAFDPLTAARRRHTDALFSSSGTSMTAPRYSGFYTPTQVADAATAAHAGTHPYAAALAAQLVLPGTVLYSDGKGNPARYLEMAERTHAVVTLSVPSVYVNGTSEETAASLNANTSAVAGLTGDAAAAHALAVLYRMTGEEQYAAAASKILMAWALTNTGAEPHERDVDGHSVEDDAPLDMAEVASGFVLAADLLTTHYTGWGVNDPNAVDFRRWVRDVYLPSVEGIMWPDMKNNWADWALYAYVLGHAYLGQVAQITDIIPIAQQMIDQQIAIDGSLPEEVARGLSGAIFYSYFALNPLCAAVRVIRNTTGTDLFRWTSPSRKTLPLALNHLLAWVKTPGAYTGPRLQDPWPADLFLLVGAEYGGGAGAYAGSSSAAYTAYAATKPNQPIIYINQLESTNFQSLMAVPGQ